MKKLLLFLYYGFFQHFPVQPFPRYKLGYWARGKIASRVFMKCGVHPIIKNKCNFGDGSMISIGNDTQLGQNSRLQGTISIGDHCVVGAGAVVTKSFPARSILAGVPAKVIKIRGI